jgi:putative ABC transport system ATP-binding protein
MDLLEEIHRAGNTIILVTHEESIARYAHRIVRLIDGQVASDEKNSDV